MVSLPVHNIAGEEVGTYEFDPNELAGGVNKQLLHDAVVMYEANRRQGSVKSKSRGEIRGSTKKLFRQKGTGRARAGALRTPVRRGGGHAFAKSPKDWSYRLPKKAVRLATRMALLSKFLDDQVVLVDELSLSEPKTRQVVAALRALGLSGESCLLATKEYDQNVWKSARNIPTVWVSPAKDLNAYSLLHQRRLLMTKDALDSLRGVGNASEE